MPVRQRVSNTALAQRAVETSDAAITMVKAVTGHIETISRSVESMRAENTSQHADGRRAITDGLEKVHTRISTIKEAQERDSNRNIESFKKVDDQFKNVNVQFQKVDDQFQIIDGKFTTVEQKIEDSRVEAREGDVEVKTAGDKNWDRVKNGILWFCAAVAVAYISHKTGLDIQLF